MKHVAALLISFLVTNWMYAEFLLLFPQVEPYCKRFMEVVKLPTHDEWSPILTSVEGKQLRSELHEFLSGPATRGVFTKIGILDAGIQQRVQNTGIFGEETPDACAGELCELNSKGNLFLKAMASPTQGFSVF
ncbi:MAG: hypothetical protein KDD62_01035 [Bdellovibrionales bacterium]|nr:hypothetical protein [Bdellovibrionales bacterium]